MSEKHEFAFYTQLPSKLFNGQLVDIHDKDLARRISAILRMKINDTCVLFDDYYSAQVQLTVLSKNYLQVLVQQFKKIEALSPVVTLFLPLLKRDALEIALYSAVELGVNKIVLVSTHKSLRAISPKEYERARAIMISAAEQSKQFAIPLLEPIINFKNALTSVSSNNLKLLCDQRGESFVQFLINIKNYREIAIIIGPEGGLTQDEREAAINSGFQAVKLTSSTLRASQAVTVALGVLRSL